MNLREGWTKFAEEHPKAMMELSKEKDNLIRMMKAECVSYDEDIGGESVGRPDADRCDMEWLLERILKSYDLTPSQRFVVSLVAEGYTASQVAKIKGCGRQGVYELLKYVKRNQLT